MGTDPGKGARFAAGRHASHVATATVTTHRHQPLYEEVWRGAVTWSQMVTKPHNTPDWAGFAGLSEHEEIRVRTRISWIPWIVRILVAHRGFEPLVSALRGGVLGR